MLDKHLQKKQNISFKFINLYYKHCVTSRSLITNLNVIERIRFNVFNSLFSYNVRERTSGAI